MSSDHECVLIMNTFFLQRGNQNDDTAGPKEQCDEAGAEEPVPEGTEGTCNLCQQPPVSPP